MIEQIGRVVAVDGGQIWVEMELGASCGACAGASGCGQGVVQKALAGRVERLRLPSSRVVRLGDRVVIGMEAEAVWNASLLVYGLPLVALVAAAGLAKWCGGGDFVVLMAAAGGLGAAGWLVKTLSSRLACNPRYHPQLLGLAEQP